MSKASERFRSELLHAINPYAYMRMKDPESPWSKYYGQDPDQDDLFRAALTFTENRDFLVRTDKIAVIECLEDNLFVWKNRQLEYYEEKMRLLAEMKEEIRTRGSISPRTVVLG